MSQTRQRSVNRGQVLSRVQPIRKPVLAHVSAEVAWARLANEGLQFLVVVEGGGGRMVGVVTRESLRPAACCARHGASCSVVNHRVPDAAFCFAGEDLEAVREMEEELSKHYPFPVRRSVPLIAVDGRLRPVGYVGECTSQVPEGRQSAA
jgi:hypothetical protein